MPASLHISGGPQKAKATPAHHDGRPNAASHPPDPAVSPHSCLPTPGNMRAHRPGFYCRRRLNDATGICVSNGGEERKDPGPSSALLDPPCTWQGPQPNRSGGSDRMKQPKGHSRRQAARNHPSRQVTELAGLFWDIDHREPTAPRRASPAPGAPSIYATLTGPDLPIDRRLVARFSRCRLLTAITVPKEVATILGNLHERFPAAPTDPQQPSITQCISRPPIPRRPGCGMLLTGREPFEQCALPFIRVRPSIHDHQPTAHPYALYRAERVAPACGSSLGLSWDFRPHQAVRA